MKVKSYHFNIDTGTIDIVCLNGAKISLKCSEIESELDTTVQSRSKLVWLIENEPLTYAHLVLNGGMQDYLNRIDKSYSEQSDRIRNQLEEKYDKQTADNIAREFMMYRDFT